MNPRPLSAVTLGGLRAYMETVRARLPEGDVELGEALLRIFGPTGRNNAGCVRVLEALAMLGLIKIRKTGHARFVSLPKE